MVISNQNHSTKINTEKTSARKLGNVKPPENNMLILPIDDRGRHECHRCQNARQRLGTQPRPSTDAARAPASAACRASSLVSSNELRSTVPPAPRNAASTLSVVILRISRNNAALPDCRVLAACLMKASLMPRSANRPLSAPEVAPTAAPASGIIKSRPISEPHSIPDTAP